MRTIPLVALVFCPLLAHAAEEAGDPRAAIDRGLAFLARDSLAWKKERNCVSCHHAALVVWALREAKQTGIAVDEPVLAEMTKWMTESGNGRSSLPRPEGRPKALNTKAVYFALALRTDPEPDDATRKSLAALLETVQSDQTEEGAWVAWPETRPPMFGPSDDSMTALATLALTPVAPAATPDAQSPDATTQESKSAEARIAARDKGVEWLARTKPDGELQSLALRLILWNRLDRPAEERQSLADSLRKRQNADGGWSQTDGMSSDAWATGQALYALAGAVKPDAPAIARGRAFLVATQRDDGSWPMTSRPSKPGGEGAKTLMPITGAGSAWGVLGLVRTNP